MSNLQKTVGEKIKNYRNRLSITQQQLADVAGFSSSQIISQIEKGEREVKAWELFKIAKALKTEIDTFLSEEEETLNLVFWRKSPLIDKKVIEAEFIQRMGRYALVEKLCSECDKKEFPQIKIDFNNTNYEEIEKRAIEISEELNLGSRPATCLSKILENDYGIKIWYQNLGEDGSAASSKGDFGLAVLINAAETPWRRNFSFAHEIFHLLTWDCVNKEKDITEDEEYVESIEKYANAFASFLLLPSKQVTEKLKTKLDEGVTYKELIEVARDFDVSTEALLYRMLNMKLIVKKREQVEELINDEDFKALNRIIRIKGWSEAPEFPERFVRLAFMAYKDGNLSRARLAEFLNTGIAELNNVLLEFGFDDQKDYQATVLAT